MEENHSGLIQLLQDLSSASSTRKHLLTWLGGSIELPFTFPLLLSYSPSPSLCSRMEESLWDAVENDEIEEVKDILRGHPDININWKSEEENETVLHRACSHGLDSVVTILLRHPDIDVNAKKSYSRETPFLLACAEGRTEVVKELLRNGQVLLNTPDKDGYTPLSLAAGAGYIDLIRWWVASGREVDLGEKPGKNADSVACAKKNNRTAVVTLLKAFKDNPQQVRGEVRKELRITGESIYTLGFPLASP